MASTRRDDLAKRLAERLDQAPAKGRAMSASVSEKDAPRSKRPSPERAPSKQPPKRAKPARPTRQRAVPKEPVPKRAARSKSTATPHHAMRRVDLPQARPRRGSTGTVLRGHLVPEAIHGDARRRKATLRSSTGVRITWDDVMCDGVALLLENPARLRTTIDTMRRATTPTGRRRLVQATMPTELDQRLVELYLDVGDQSEAGLTYEQLWACAILLWLESSDDLVDS